MSQRPRILLFSTLYPSSVRAGHGIFVENRLRELMRRFDVDVRVVAPVPWFPSTNPRWGDWASFAATPPSERRNGIEVSHPRYLLPPRVGMTPAPLLLALGAAPAVARLRRTGFDFDLIDAHYYYPDGVAAALLGKWFDRPLTITARGSDLNLIGTYRIPRWLMQWASRRAAASIGVSQALVDVLRGWDVNPSQLHLMRNGVDLDRFAPRAKESARQRLRLHGHQWLLSVGNLVELKGHDLVIAALAYLRQTHGDVRLAIVGRGPERPQLERLAANLGLAESVVFVGAVPQPDLVDWYSAADALVLASSREGMPNVLLECMACGTPVAATAVGGVPEVLKGAPGCDLVKIRSAEGIAAAVAKILTNPIGPEELRAHAVQFDWQATSASQLALFNQIRARNHA